ncbi:hypothetical protein PLICRDRAFT_216929 [Plicaturopsis crispa FD-325 SS-3]|nr:hypothetical protein PLICRDRAFT_216929 [Plicaturopsis crispa FD-325 SS-3]
MRFTTIFAAVLCAFASTTFALPTSVPANGVSSVVRPANLTHVVIERETAFGQPIQAKRDCGVVCQFLQDHFGNVIH